MALPDPPIVTKMIAARKSFEQAADETRKKLFQARVALPRQFRLSKDAWEQYQNWAAELEAELIADKRNKLVTKAKESNLHAIFAGLTVLMDEDLPGLSVFVD